MIVLALALAAASLGGAERGLDASRLGLVAFRRVAIPDEAPAHLCTALAEDRDGFLWIGTQGGLVRYDGYDFRVFKSVPDDPRSFGGSYVRTLLAGSDGRLWAGTFSGGLSMYDPATETFTRYRHDPQADSSLSHDRVEALAEDRSGAIWVATYAGLDRIDPTSGRIEPVALPETGRRTQGEGLDDDRLRALLVDHAGRLWVGGRGGLLRLNDTDGRFEPVALGTGKRPFVSRLYEDDRQRLWVGTADDGAAVLDPDGQVHLLRPRPAQRDGLSHFYVYGIAPGGPGEVWLATFGGGVDVVDTESLRVVDRLRHDPTDESTIGGDRVGGLLRDRAGLVWVGTWGQGLARHDPSTRAFRSLRYSTSRREGLSHPAAVRALEMQDGALWVGTNGNGIDVFDWVRGRVGGYRPSAADPGALADGSITCLAQAADGTIWVATLDGTLHRLRPRATRFERVTAADGLPGGAIRAMTFGPDGALWAGSSEGLARLDPATSRISRYRHDPDDPTTLSGHEVEALVFDPSGILWVGTGNGLNALDPATGRAVRIRHQPERPDSLPNNWVPDLLLADDGRLWVATEAGACILVAWDGRSARFEQVATRLGRNPERVQSLIQDAQGFVWMGARLRVDPRTWQAREFSPADGLAFRNFFIASRSRTSSGALLFGSPEGLAIVRPERLQSWDYAPPVLPTSLRVEGRERAGAARLTELQLSEHERSFQLQVAALDLSAPLRLRYRYRLEGFDADWIGTDAARRTLTYTNLPPGSYRLHVQATNRAGRTSPRELRLPVRVLPAFQQTNTFRGLMGLLGLGLVYAAHRLRIRRLESRRLELERLVDERTRELQAANARIEEASLTDPLTGLRNRRFLERSIQGDVDLATRRHADGPEPVRGADLVFLMVDLDHFKRVNDTHGHAAGDAVLQQAAENLRQQMRSSDYVVRWGGEEFLVVARFVDRAEAPQLAEKLRASMAGWAFLLDDGTSLRLTCSAGFATYPLSRTRPRVVGWERVVEVADVGLYAAKRDGRNRWVGFDASDSDDPQAVVQRLQEGAQDGLPGARRLGSPA